MAGGVALIAAEVGEENTEENVSALSATKPTPRQNDVAFLIIESANASNRTVNWTRDL